MSTPDRLVRLARPDLRPRLLGSLIALVTLGAAACRRADDGGIRATGTLEATEIDVAPTSAGRVIRVLVDEGAYVAAGDTLAVLARPGLPGDLEGRRARVASAEAALRELENGPRPAELARAEADLRAAEADAERAAADARRLAPLAERGVISAQQSDAARGAAAMASGRRDAAREALHLLQQGTRAERIREARAALASAQAAVREAEGTASDLVLLAPIGGVVLGRHVEPGETLNPGEPAVTLGDVAHPYVRVYVPERALPRVHIGAPAAATLDGLLDHSFPGRVVAIADRAEYTPRIALTEQERADLVFGVKITLDDSTGTLRPGLPATVTVAPTMRDVRLRLPPPADRPAAQPLTARASGR